MRRRLACSLLALAACAHARPGTTERSEWLCGGALELRYTAEDAEVAGQVRAALERALPVATAWGALTTPVRVTVRPTHEALEAAARRSGVPWLRAFAGHAAVELESPRTWARGRDEAVARLLTHELTHSVLLQASAHEAGRPWPIPLWFFEGMASVTAGERHGPLPTAVLASLRDGPGGSDALVPSARLYREHPEVVYGTADRLFRFLLERHGRRGVRDLIAAMRSGLDFFQAFRSVTGSSLREFEAEFRKQLAAEAAEPVPG